MKKLCAIMLLVLVAALFASSAAFAAYGDRVAPATPSIAAGDLPSSRYHQPGAARLVLMTVGDTFTQSADIARPNNLRDAITSNDVDRGIWTTGGVTAGSADLAIVSQTYAENLSDGVFSAPVRDRQVLQLHYVTSIDYTGMAAGAAAKDDFVVFGFALANEFYGKKASEIRAVKAVTDISKKVFEMVYDAKNLGDGKSLIVRRAPGIDDEVLGADDIVGAKSGTYHVVVSIQDNGAGDFDLASKDMQVVDPSFAIAANPVVWHTTPNILLCPITVTQTRLSIANIQLNDDVAPAAIANMVTMSDKRYQKFRYLKGSILDSFGFTSLANVQELPAFSALSPNLGTIVVLYYLDAEKFNGRTVEDIKVSMVELDAANQFKKNDFEMVFEGAGIGGGKAAIVTPDGTNQRVMAKSDKIESGKTYLVAIAVKDNSLFDVDSSVAGNIQVAPFVYTEAAPVTPALEITAPSTSMKPGDSVEFTAEVKNSDKTFKMAWSSDNTDVATVGEEDGVVVAVAVGEATIKCVATEVLPTATGVAEAEVYEDTVKVTVAQDTPSGGDSSSGCSVGGFAPATLLLLAPLFLLLKK